MATKRCRKCGLFIGSKEHVCKSVDLRGKRYCIFCGKKLNNNIDRERWHAYCKSCSSKRSHIWEMIRLRKLANAFGGECQICGFRESKVALDFHHLTKTKEKKRFVGEISKHPERFCLLCANHHRMVTFGVVKAPKSPFTSCIELPSVTVTNNEIDKEWEYK